MIRLPNENKLPKGRGICGYVATDGTYYHCNSCEHEQNIRKIIWENKEYRNLYFQTPSYAFDEKPFGMLQEEFFAMVGLGFVKISSFKETPMEMVVFNYTKLTPQQIDFIYPR